MDGGTSLPNVVVVMGVAGAGKTVVGQALSAAIGWPFYEGDAFHPAANIAKMTRGEGLTDEDRAPWLAALRDLISGVVERGEHAVLACSALKHSYRNILASDAPPAASEGGSNPGMHTHRSSAVRFVYLDVPPEVLKARLEQRRGHFAPPSLLPSQLEALEEPRDALWVDGTQPPPSIVVSIREALGV